VNTQYTEMSTIPRTLNRLHTDGYPISMRSLRTWVKNGDIPAVICGNRPYIWYPAVIEFLQRGNSATQVQTPAEINGIRRIC